MIDHTTLYFTHPAKRRYYHVDVLTDLLHCPVIHISHGSLDSRRGRRFSIPYASNDDLKDCLVSIKKMRAAHGYVIGLDATLN